MRTVKRYAAAAAVVATFVLAPAAFAAFDDYPAGESCAFPLRVEFSDGPGLKIHELVDRNGNDVLVFTGSSPLLIVSNLDSGESITFKSKGQRLEIIFYEDGSNRVVATGHTLVVWTAVAPEVPLGTFHYIGKLIIDTDASGESTILMETGRRLDVCAALG